MEYLNIVLSWLLFLIIIAINKILGMSDGYLIAIAILYASFIYVEVNERRYKK